MCVCVSLPRFALVADPGACMHACVLADEDEDEDEDVDACFYTWVGESGDTL